MNLWRGLARGWIVLSAAWSLFVLLMAVSYMGPNAPSGGWDIQFWREPMLAMLIRGLPDLKFTP